MKTKYKNILFYVLLTILYCTIFILIYGYTNFDIHYTDWCMIKRDYANPYDIIFNYLNFIGFLNDSAPIPYYTDLIYPFKGSLLFIDYVPILAIFIKIFYKYILHSDSIINIQYAWYFGVICFIAQGILSFKIIKKASNTSNLNAILCSIFFVIAPPMLFKFPYQFTLAAQFLILLSFCPFVFEYNKKQIILLYFLLGFMSSGIFIYFLPFIFINMLVYIVYCLNKDHNINSFVSIPSLAIGVSIPIILTHGVNLDVTPQGTGLGAFTANFNTFINPINMYNLFRSNLFPFLNNLQLYSVDQNEGFAYLGGGVIVLIISSVVYLFFKYKFKQITDYLKKHYFETALFVLTFVMVFLLAASFKITLGRHLIYEVEFNKAIEDFLAIFRTTGRFIWDNFYLIYFTLFIFLAKNIKGKILTTVLMVGLLAQIYDLYPTFKILRSEYQPKIVYKNPLDNDPVWNKLIQGKKKIVACSFYPFEYTNLVEYAIRHKLKVNNMQLSREIDRNKYNEYLNDVYYNLKDDILYAFSNIEIDFVIKNTNLKNCYFVAEDKYVCTKEKIK